MHVLISDTTLEIASVPPKRVADTFTTLLDPQNTSSCRRCVGSPAVRKPGLRAGAAEAAHCRPSAAGLAARAAAGAERRAGAGAVRPAGGLIPYTLVWLFHILLTDVSACRCLRKCSTVSEAWRHPGWEAVC